MKQVCDAEKYGDRTFRKVHLGVSSMVSGWEFDGAFYDGREGNVAAEMFLLLANKSFRLT